VEQGKPRLEQSQAGLMGFLPLKARVGCLSLRVTAGPDE